jgi:hypothetical protein
MNYYFYPKKVCHTCGRQDQNLHIGKSSAGWKFCFRSYPEESINSYSDWLQLLEDPNSEIRDELDTIIPLEELKELIESTQKFKPPTGFLADDQGYYFLNRDFS